MVSAKKLSRASRAPALVGEDRGGDQRVARVVRGRGARRRRAIDPAGVDAAARGTRRTRAGRSGSPCCSRRPRSRDRDRAARTTSRLRASLARLAGRDHLGDQRVERRRHDAARGDAGVDANARSERGIEAGDAPGCGQRSRRRGPRRTRAPRSRRRARTPRRPASVSPRAMRICSSTRSSPVTASVMPCSTCRRGFISRKQAVVAATRNSTVPSPTYPTALARRTAAADSCVEQLRREPGRRRLLDHLLVAPLHRAVARAEREHVPVRIGGDLDLDVARRRRPCARGRGGRRRRRRAPPPPRRGTRPAAPRRPRRRGCRVRRRRPPPSRPADSRGAPRTAPPRRRPRRRRRSTARRARRRARPAASRRSCRRARASPSPDGPRKRMPSATTRSANAGSSATNPQPGQTASAPARRSAAITRSWSR